MDLSPLPLRITRHRRIILEEVAKVGSHPTADEVFARVRKRLPRVSLATVYRNLELMAEHGLIRRLDFAKGPARFDSQPRTHYHLRCLRCGTVDDLPLAPLPTMESRAAAASGYRVTGHRLEFLGLCPDCQRESPRPRRARRKPKEEC